MNRMLCGLLLLLSIGATGAAEVPAYGGPVTAREVRVRDGIGHVMEKIRAGKEVRIAYFGGSITEMDGWRRLSREWLQEQYPAAKFSEIAAAIGGTGSSLGVYRFRQDVLEKNPDLVFVEFATNDSKDSPESIWRNFDGFIRQAWRTNPEIDFVFVYTITQAMEADYRKGLCTRAASAMEQLADHYGIPSVGFGPRVIADITGGKLVWTLGEFATAVPAETPDRDKVIAAEMAAQGKVLFSKDGVHPVLSGHAYYIESLKAAWPELAKPAPVDHAGKLTAAFYDSTMEAAKMVSLTPDMLSGVWKTVAPNEPNGNFAARFGAAPHLTETPGSKLRFLLKGTGCRVYDLVGPGCGQVRITVDGVRRSSPVPRFDRYCTYCRVNPLMVFSGAEGVHEIELELDADEPDRSCVKVNGVTDEELAGEKYRGRKWYVGRLMIVGDVIPEKAKHWMCPQMEMELYRVHQMRDDVRRMGLYAGHPGKLPMTRDNAFFRRKCAKDAPLPETWGAVRSTRYDEAEGRRYVEVRAGFSGCAAIRGAETDWEAQVFDGSWRPVAVYPDAPLPPHRERLPEDRTFAGLVATNGYYDAGEELFAFVECVADGEPRLFVGESVPEMMDEDRHHLEYDPTMVQVADGRWRTQQPLAFRYLRFASDPRDVKVVPVGRNRPVVGRILTDKARWSQMFDVGVRTLARCSDEFLIDGVKRDRLPWAGDLTVSLMADAYVYGDAEVARRSLSVMDAYQGDVNGIVTYSMWTVISHDLYQLYFGDRKFLEDRWWRIKWRIDDLVSRCDENGFVSRGLGWVFIDWAKPESRTAMHMIWYGALQAAARLAARVNDPCASSYRALAEKVRANLNRSAWDATRGLYCADPGDFTVFGRQANIFAIVFDVADDAAKKRIGEELASDRLPPVGTPYVYGWELVALNRTGHHRAFFDGLERVFGAMLDAGATTFWEGYDANEKGDARYRFYGRPWGKSLCHVWSAWPAFVFVSEGLGVKPTSDGWKTWEQKPIPGAEGLRALVPTPQGVLTVGK